MPEDSDLDMLYSVLQAYDLALTLAQDKLTSVGLAPTVRLKTTGTLIDKLRREHSMKLKSVQDVAGARIIIEGTLSDQDRIAGIIERLFADDARPPRIVDRRASPSSGYRAVHVVVFSDGLPVEIQVRTKLQNDWAQIFESLGDVWGRAIRYGGDPVPASIGAEMSRQDVVDLMMDLSQQVARIEETKDSYPGWSNEVVDPDERLGPELRSVHEELRRATAMLEASVMGILESVGRMVEGG